MAKRKKTKVKSKEVDESLLCLTCNNTAITSHNAYVSYSFFAINGRMPICKKCAINIFLEYYKNTKDERLAIFYTCRKLDVPFVESIYKSAISHRKTIAGNNVNDINYKPTPLFAYYMSRIYTSSAKPFGEPKMFDEGSQFTDINGKIVDKDDIEKNELEINETKIKELVDKWGTNSSMRIEDYMYLENHYDGMVRSYGAPKDYSGKMYFRDIAMTNLDIKKIRETGGSIEKLIKLRNQLIDEASISPIDPNSKDKTPPIGVITKMIENEKPIITQDKKYKDVDKFRELSLQVTGQLAKMEGKTNMITEEYDKWLNKHAIDFEKIQNEVNNSEDDDINISDEDEEL